MPQTAIKTDLEYAESELLAGLTTDDHYAFLHGVSAYDQIPVAIVTEINLVSVKLTLCEYPIQSATLRKAAGGAQDVAAYRVEIR